MAQRDDALLRVEVLMYVAIRRYDGIEPSAVAEFVRRVTADSGASAPAVEQELDRWAAEGGFVPQPRETPGFEAYYLVDAGNGVVVSISLFGDRDAAEESTRGAAEWVSRNLADLIRLPPQVLTGEVVAQRTTEHPPLA
jgi:hypothetical protein